MSHLTPSLVRICGVRCLLGEVEALRAQPYSQEDEEHERMLLEVGEHLPPFCGDRQAVSIGEDYNISVTVSIALFHSAVVSAGARRSSGIPSHQAVAGHWFPRQQPCYRLQGDGSARAEMPPVS